MLPPILIILIITDYLETAIAITLNTYIVITNVKSIKKGLSLNPSHLIHLLMGLVNIILQSSLLVHGSIYIFCAPSMFIKEVYYPLIIMIFTMIYCSFWLTAWLCAYYCTSITNFRYGLCVWLQRIRPSCLLLLLLLSALVLFLISLLSIWNIEAEVKVSENITQGNSFISGTFHLNPLYLIIASCLGSFLPFILILYSIILTVSSLLRHMCNMQHNDSGFPRSKLQAHINAIRTIILILVVFVTFCIAMIMFFTTEISTSPDDRLLISWFIIMSYPTAESIIVIQASSKLRRIIAEKFCAVCWRNMKTEN